MYIMSLSNLHYLLHLCFKIVYNKPVQSTDHVIVTQHHHVIFDVLLTVHLSI